MQSIAQIGKTEWHKCSTIGFCLWRRQAYYIRCIQPRLIRFVRDPQPLNPLGISACVPARRTQRAPTSISDSKLAGLHWTALLANSVTLVERRHQCSVVFNQVGWRSGRMAARRDWDDGRELRVRYPRSSFKIRQYPNFSPRGIPYRSSRAFGLKTDGKDGPSRDNSTYIAPWS